MRRISRKSSHVTTIRSAWKLNSYYRTRVNIKIRIQAAIHCVPVLSSSGCSKPNRLRTAMRHDFKVNATLAIKRQIRRQMYSEHQLARSGVGQWFIFEAFARLRRVSSPAGASLNALNTVSPITGWLSSLWAHHCNTRRGDKFIRWSVTL